MMRYYRCVQSFAVGKAACLVPVPGLGHRTRLPLGCLASSAADNRTTNTLSFTAASLHPTTDSRLTTQEGQPHPQQTHGRQLRRGNLTLRTPRSPTGSTSGRPRWNMANMSTVQGPMPLTAVRDASSSGSLMPAWAQS
jgi:hypothetical protein